MKLLSIVVTLYNQQKALEFFYQALTKDVKNLPVNYEYIFIDNGSCDNTLSTLRNLAEKDFHFHYISMHHNISVIESLYIGMQYAQGDYILFMDIQHPTYMIEKLYNVIEEKQVSDVGGCLQRKNSSSKKQKYFRMIRSDIGKDYFDQQDLDGFKSCLHHSHEHTLWLPYTNMEETRNTLFQQILFRLNLKYERRIIYVFFVTLICTLFFIPMILIFHYYLEVSYSIYISLLLTLCAFAMMEVIHSRYCFFCIKKRQKKIKESTFHNS